MLEQMKYYLGVMFYNFRLEILKELEYAIYSIAWLIMIPLSAFSGYYVLWLMTQQNGNINGWTIGELAFLYGLSMFSHAFQDMFFIQTRFIDYQILEGSFDRALLRPMNVFFQFCTENLNICGLYDLIPAIALFAYGCQKVHFVWNIGNVLGVGIVMIGGTLISAAIYTITGSIAFWTRKSGFLVDLDLTFIEKTTSYPLNVYPKFFSLIFTFLVPMGFISFYPACGFLHKSTGLTGKFPLPPELPIWSLLVGILCFFLAQKFFMYGLRKKYESAGS